MLLENHNAIESGGYSLERSLRFRSSASAYLSRTPASAGNRTTWTWSGWVKFGVTSTANQGIFSVGNSSTGDLIHYNYGSGLIRWFLNGASSGDLATSQSFRDPSAWYHLMFVFGTTQATSSNRMKMYVNGVQITSFVTATYPSQNYQGVVNTAAVTRIGFNTDYNYLDGYITEVNFIDGQALTPTSFGEFDATTGVWKPKKYAGTYGTNGFYLNFNDNSAATAAAIGKDSSGNGNNWTPNNISLTAGVTYDSMTDVPTLTSASASNYAVLNPLATPTYGAFSAGNLQYVGANTWMHAKATIEIPSTGKWYAEATLTGNALNNIQGDAYTFFGACPAGRNPAGAGDGNNLVIVDTGWYYNFVAYPSGVNTGSPLSTGNVIGLAIDRDANTYTFYKNNVSVATGTINYSAGSPLTFCYGSYDGSHGNMAINFGQRPFAYTPPSGFKSLNTFNLPDSTIVKSSKYFDIALDTGANIKTTVEALFTNDLVWIKDRANTNNHQLIDSVRGSTAVLQSNTTTTETTYTAPSGSSVGWSWKAGASTVTNNDGQITSQVSASPASGFSVVTFTADGTTKTVGHGLGVKPSLIMVKSRNALGGFLVITDVVTGAMQYGQLNSTAAFASIGYSAPTSSVFQYNDNNGNTQVAYCFAEIAGFSKFGSYTGNGSADGPFVYCGFRPKYVLIKKTSAADEWFVWDSSRSTINQITGGYLIPNLNVAEGAVNAVMDLVSNGFKIRGTDTSWNLNGATFIFMAFAEVPTKYALAR